MEAVEWVPAAPQEGVCWGCGYPAEITEWPDVLCVTCADEVLADYLTMDQEPLTA